MERASILTAGNLVVSRDLFGNATVWEWDDVTGYLQSVTDVAGNRVTVQWNDTTVVVASPSASVTARPVVLEKDSGVLAVLTDRAGEKTTFSYDTSEETAGLVTGITHSSGASVRVDYSVFPDRSASAKSLILRDDSGNELANRTWATAGDNLSTRYPVHDGGENALWSSGDSE